MYYLFIILSIVLFSCDNSTKSQDIHGCLDSQACNYNPNANIDNNSCNYIEDCNGDCGGDAVVDDCGVCNGDNSICYGCTDENSCNYNQNANIDDDSCWSEEDTGCPCAYGEDPPIAEGCALILNSEQEECETTWIEECDDDDNCEQIEIEECETIEVSTTLEVDYCGEECPDQGDCEIGGLVEDCSDDDCCPEIWIHDGYCDDEKQLYGCDLSCYDEEEEDCSDTVNSNPPLKDKVYKF